MGQTFDFATLTQFCTRQLARWGLQPQGRQGQWQGTIDGRTWKVSLSRDQRTRYAGDLHRRITLGVRLRVDLAMSTGAQLFVIRQDFVAKRWVQWLYRLRRFEVLRPTSDSLQPFCVVTPQPEWGQPFVQNLAFQDLVGTLMVFQEASGASSSVYIQPDGLYYASPRLQPKDIQEAFLEHLFQNLADLSANIARLPPPLHPVTQGPLSRWIKKHPALGALGLLVGLGGGCAVVIMVILALIAWILT
jgi:hypothetical protein